MKLKLLRYLFLGLILIAPLLAQEIPPPPAPPQSAGDLDQMLGPIALYPDALIALILPSATDPSDVVLAARFLQDGGDPSDTDDQPWDDSLKALVHYPDVVKWMDQNLTWTQQVGEAFLQEPGAVMNSIQHLRSEATAAGTLTSSPQQEVINDDNGISIIPAQPDEIYVPDYDPNVVYLDHPGFSSDPYLTFGAGYPTGYWLGYDMDWRHRRIWTIDPRDRERYWREHRDWQHPSFPGRPGYVHDPDRHPWKPPANYPWPTRPPTARPDAPRPPPPRPTPFPHGAVRPNDPRHNGPDRPPGNGQPGQEHNRPSGNQPSPQPGSRAMPPLQPQVGRQPVPVPARDDRPDSQNRGRESRDVPRPPVAAPARQGQPPPPPPRPAPPPAARDDKPDDKKP